MLESRSIVISLKGHDAKRKYIVIKLDKDFAYVCDGKYRTMANLKKKRIKHLKDTNKKYEGKLLDFEIVKALKEN